MIKTNNIVESPLPHPTASQSFSVEIMLSDSDYQLRWSDTVTRHCPYESNELMETFFRENIEERGCEDVLFSWVNCDYLATNILFLRRILAIQKKYHPSGNIIKNDIYINYLIIDSEWAELLDAHNFLVWISLEGPKKIYGKAYRKNYQRTMLAVDALQRYQLLFNARVSINSISAGYAEEIYAFLTRYVGVHFINFLPFLGPDETDMGVKASSVTPAEWGVFILDVFEEWLSNEVGFVQVNLSDAARAQFPNPCLDLFFADPVWKNRHERSERYDRLRQRGEFFYSLQNQNWKSCISL
ncbi:hypothetical protein RABR111495_24160 [Rahnella bruchi]|uniref:hypothetical protein n=1 Tax=Rahnella bruchi TaxID=1510573 RepID=UPI0013C4F02A|nr:hypothetical protein [Rahnella bruchi]